MFFCEFAKFLRTPFLQNTSRRLLLFINSPVINELVKDAFKKIWYRGTNSHLFYRIVFLKKMENCQGKQLMTEFFFSTWFNYKRMIFWQFCQIFQKSQATKLLILDILSNFDEYQKTLPLTSIREKNQNYFHNYFWKSSEKIKNYMEKY